MLAPGGAVPRAAGPGGDARRGAVYNTTMHPYELRDDLEDAEKRGRLDKEGLRLLALVRRVVARLDELRDVIFPATKPAGQSFGDYLNEHTDELREYVELMGPALFGDLKPLPESEALGVADAQTALRNAKVFKRRHEARERGWYIEAIALTAYQLEEWLRIWIVSRGGGESFHPDDRHQLSHLIDEAERVRLEPKLVTRLSAFNGTRNRAIHRLLRGEIAYGDLAVAYDADRDLPEALTEWVIERLPTFEEAAREWDPLDRWRQWAATHPE